MLYYMTALLSVMKDGWTSFRESRFRSILLSFIFLIVVGTFAYSWIEGWPLQQSLYFIIITITTVGYGDYSPQSPAGQNFAIIFTLIAIGLAGYAISALASIIFELDATKLERKLGKTRMKKITDLQDHTIICGGSIAGNRATNEFRRRKQPFVLIEESEEKLREGLLWMHDEYVRKFLQQLEYKEETIDLEKEELMSVAQLAEEAGVLYIIGDPTSERVLNQAGLRRAKGIITAMEDDRDNISILLSVKDMTMKMKNHSILTVSTAGDQWSIRKLYLAGAQKVIAPDFLGGLSLATNILDPEVGELWNQMLFSGGTDARMRDFPLSENQEYIGQSASAFCAISNFLLVALKRNGEYIFSPPLDLIFEEDDILIVMGHVGH